MFCLDYSFYLQCLAISDFVENSDRVYRFTLCQSVFSYLYNVQLMVNDGNFFSLENVWSSAIILELVGSWLNSLMNDIVFIVNCIFK